MEKQTCPGCGAELKAEILGGLCPQCVLGKVMAQPANSPLRFFGDYELLEEIARGGMGVVYRARQVSLNRLVALKMIRSGELASEAEVKRFRLEAQAAAKLDHPNIVPIFEVGDDEGQHFFSMRLVEGPSLAALISNPERRMSNVEAVKLLVKVAQAVHFAHQHGVVHRDLKPANVLIDPQGEPHVTDFGLAKRMNVDSMLESSGQTMGTPSYIPPEQVVNKRGNVGPHSDVYSLGATLYHLLSGRPPFQGAVADILAQVQHTDPVSPRLLNPQVPRDLETICLKCLEKDPGRRYGTARELAEELDRWLQHKPIQARRAGPLLRTNRWVTRNPIAACLVLSLLLGLTTALILLQRTRAEEKAKTRALNILIKTIDSSISQFGQPSQPHLTLTSEELMAFTQSQPPITSGPKACRFCVGTFMVLHPTETFVGFAGVLSRLEQEMSRRLKKPVRLDLRVYKDHALAQNDLVQGKTDFMRVEPRLYVEARDHNPGILPLVREEPGCLEGVIFTLPDTGITNLPMLKGHTLAFWDRPSVPSVLAKARLVEADLCQGDLRCEFLRESGDLKKYPISDFAERAPGGYFAKQSATIDAVLGGKSDAGVALDFQLRQYTNFFVPLATFEVPLSFWACRSDLDTNAVEAFKAGMLALRDSRVPMPTPLNIDEGDEMAFTAADDRRLEPLSQALRQEPLFDRGLPKHSESSGSTTPDGRHQTLEPRTRKEKL